MSRLLNDALRNTLPKLRAQEYSKNPIVHAVFYFPIGGWKWFVTEGEPNGEDFMFFGYVLGFEAEFGYFSLSELEDVDIHALKVERVENFRSTALKECVSIYV